MKLTLVVSHLILLLSGVLTKSFVKVKGENHYKYTQKLDHFSLTNNSPTFTCYFKSYLSDICRGNDLRGVLLYLSMEQGSRMFSTPAWVDNLADNKCLMIITMPIRFYSNYEEQSSFFSSDNLPNLRISQIIEDIVDLIDRLKNEQFHTIRDLTPFFVMGQQSLGAICLMALQQYSRKISGCIAQDPFVNLPGDFKELDLGIHYKFKQISEDCLTKVLYFSEQFALIQENYYENFISTLYTKFSQHSKYDIILDIAQRLLEVTESQNLAQFCSEFINYRDFFHAIELIYDDRFNYFESETKIRMSLSQLTQSNLNSQASRLWFWQQCTEFGLFQTYNPLSKITDISLDILFYKKRCIDAFGEQEQLFSFMGVEENSTSQLQYQQAAKVVWSLQSTWFIGIQMLNNFKVSSTNVLCQGCNFLGFINGSQSNQTVDQVWILIENWIEERLKKLQST